MIWGYPHFLGNLHVFLGQKTQKTWLASLEKNSQIAMVQAPQARPKWTASPRRMDLAHRQKMGDFCTNDLSIEMFHEKSLINIKWNGDIDLSLKFKLSLKNGEIHHWKMGGKFCSDKLLIEPLKFFEKCQVAPPSVGVQPPGTQHLEEPRMGYTSVAAGLTFSATQKSKSGHHPGLIWKMNFKWMFFTVFCSQQALLTLSFRPSLRNSKSRIATSAHHLDFRCRGDAGNWNFNWSVTEFQLFRYI